MKRWQYFIIGVCSAILWFFVSRCCNTRIWSSGLHYFWLSVIFYILYKDDATFHGTVTVHFSHYFSLSSTSVFPFIKFSSGLANVWQSLTMCLVKGNILCTFFSNWNLDFLKCNYVLTNVIRLHSAYQIPIKQVFKSSYHLKTLPGIKWIHHSTSKLYSFSEYCYQHRHKD